MPQNNTDSLISLSAVNKKQTANAAILFGKNAAVLIKRLDELVKVKELDTAKIEAILDMLNDEDATTAYAKKAAGKNLATAVKNLYKAKTLVVTINALRAIKIKLTDPNKVAAVKPEKVAKTRVRGKEAPVKPAVVLARPVNANAKLPAVNIASIGPKFMNSVTQSKIDAIAAQLSAATGLTFIGSHTPSNGQSSDWSFIAQNPNSRYRAVHIDPPYEFHEYESSPDWHISAETHDGKYAISQERLRKCSAETIAKAVAKLVGKTLRPSQDPGTYKLSVGTKDVTAALNADIAYFADAPKVQREMYLEVLAKNLSTTGKKFNVKVTKNGVTYTPGRGEPTEKLAFVKGAWTLTGGKGATGSTFSPAYSSLRRQNAMQYAQDFITAVEPEPGRGVLLTTGRSIFRFQYKKLNIGVSMLQKGWAMVFEGPHLKAPRTIQIHLGELESIKNVIKLLSTKDANDLQIAAAAKKGARTAAQLRM